MSPLPCPVWFCAVLCVFTVHCLSAFSFAQSPSTSVSSLRILSVSGNSRSGCIDSAASTGQCSFPLYLTLTTSPQPALLRPSVSLVLAASNVEAFADVTLSANSTSLTTWLSPQSWDASWNSGGPLSLFFFDSSTGTSSPPFPSVSLAYHAPPVVSDIAGCQGSGEGTFDCDPDSTVVTFKGSGLYWYRATSRTNLLLGGVSVQVGYTVNGLPYGGLSIIDDSTATLSFARLATYLLLPSHYGGTVLPIAFSVPYQSTATRSWSAYTSASLSISFAPLPLPNVTSVQVARCTPLVTTDNVTVYTDCVPLVSGLQFTGRYMYANNVSVSVEGILTPMSCVARENQLVCGLPLLNTFTPPGQLLDVVVRNDAGSVTLPRFFSLTTKPALSLISKCLDFDIPSNSGALCYPGSSITVRGANFQAAANYSLILSSSLFLWTRQQSSVNITCLELAVRNNNTLTCTLPVLDEQTGLWFYDQYVTTLLLSSASYPSAINSLYSSVYQWPDAPSISAIFGCQAASDPLEITGCPSGAVITLTGSNLGGSGYSILAAGASSVVCGLLTESSTNSSLTCLLLFFDGFDTAVMTGLQYHLYLWLRVDHVNRTGVGKRSNYFTVSFASPPPPAEVDSNTSSDFSTGAVVGVVVGGLVLMVAVLATAWLWYRKKCVPQRAVSSELLARDGGEDRGWSHSSEVGDVQLQSFTQL